MSCSEALGRSLAHLAIRDKATFSALHASLRPVHTAMSKTFSFQASKRSVLHFAAQHLAATTSLGPILVFYQFTLRCWLLAALLVLCCKIDQLAALSAFHSKQAYCLQILLSPIVCSSISCALCLPPEVDGPSAVPLESAELNALKKRCVVSRGKMD